MRHTDGKKGRGNGHPLCILYSLQFPHTDFICDPSAVKFEKTMEMQEMQESQKGLNMAHHWELIQTQSCSVWGKKDMAGAHKPILSTHIHSKTNSEWLTVFFHTNTVKHIYTQSCTHSKWLACSHTWAHTFCRFSSWPVLQGRETMYETAQIKTFSYLWLWPMTYVYLHYALVHFKSFTSVGGYWYGRDGEELWMKMRISLNESLNDFRLPFFALALPGQPIHKPAGGYSLLCDGITARVGLHWRRSCRLFH